ncbi:MAG: hypothetical protein GY807_23780 [Gammaproteobacteria bacterium]|nr:hypothetical protein [Gammaproteobacteria bacterium]
METHVRIQRYSPWWRRALFALGLFALLLFCGLSYWVGHSVSGYENERAGWEINVLRLKLTELEEQKTRLLRQLALLQQSTGVKFEAYKEAKRSLNAMETRMMRLKEELLFYKNIVSPSELKRGLHLQEIRVSRANKERGYLYRLVITQISGKGLIARGKVSINIIGKQNGNPVTLSLKDLSPQQDTDIPFSFKYFQTLEGGLMMPLGFAPSDVNIQVDPRGKRLDTIQRSYSWKKLLAGGI